MKPRTASRLGNYSVSEIFGPTIQGEGFNAGRPCVFLRFAGCNLWGDPGKPSPTCPWCDTPQLHSHRKTSGEDIVNSLHALAKEGSGLVITGGEPLLQLDDVLLRALSSIFPWVDIETNGTVRPKFDTVPRNVKISLSPKTEKIVIPFPDQVKVLIPDNERLLPLVDKFGPVVFLQPIEPLGGTDTEEYRDNVRRCVDLAIQRGYRLSLQLHKLVGLP